MSIKYSTGRNRQCAKCEMRKTHTRETCPSAEEVISFAANPMASPDADMIFGHLLECDDCRESLAFVISANHAMVSQKARSGSRARGKSDASALSIALFLSRNPARKVAGTAATAEQDAIAAGIEPGDGHLYFHGGRGGPDGVSWQAEVGVPQGDVAQDFLDVRVSCKIGGADAYEGVFRLCGATAEIKNGEGRLSREALAESLATGGVSFKPAGRRAVVGTPMFGGLQ